jgi:hypothetical protein
MAWEQNKDRFSDVGKSHFLDGLCAGALAQASFRSQKMGQACLKWANSFVV